MCRSSRCGAQMLAPLDVEPRKRANGGPVTCVLSPTQSGVAGPDDRLGAVGCLQLGEDVGDVVADRLGGEVERRRDLRVVLPGRDQVEDLELALGELRE